VYRTQTHSCFSVIPLPPKIPERFCVCVAFWRDAEMVQPPDDSW